MSNCTPAGGIDCGRDFLDVGVYPDIDQLLVENNPAGHGLLKEWLTERAIAIVGVEASGGYERAARDALQAAEISVRVFDPGRVRFFARAKGRRAKNDRLDAAVIAEFTAPQTEAPVLPIDPAREEMAGLIKARRLLVDKRADLTKGMAHVPVAVQSALRGYEL